MTIATNIQRRGPRFYVRARVPVDLRDVLKHAEVWKSLFTTDASEARRRAPRVMAELHEKWDAARARRDAAIVTGPLDRQSDLLSWCVGSDPRGDAATVLAAWFKRESARTWHHYHGGAQSNAPALETALAEIDDPYERHHRATGYASALAAHDLDELRRAYEAGDYQRAYDAVAEVFGALGQSVSQSEQKFTVMAREVMRAKGELASARERWAEGDLEYSVEWAPALPETLFGPPASSLAAAKVTSPDPSVVAAPKVPSDTLSALTERYLSERQRNLSVEWLGTQRAIFQLFLEDAGQTIPARQIDKRIARDWKERLQQFPSRGTLRGERLPFREIIERNAIEKRPTLSNRTVNKYITAMSTLFDWLIRHDHADQNPFAGLAIADSSSDSSRDPFSAAQLQAIFSSPLFTGCAGNDRRGLTTPGPVMIRDWRYWLPILMLFTGARPGELAQLTLNDIQTRAGATTISINSTGGKKVKTKNARRLIPIHKALIDLGFPSMAERAKANGQERLFPEIRPDSMGRYSSMPNDVLNTYLVDTGVKVTSRVCLYSLRHNFMDGLREAGFSDAEFAPLVGHGTTGPAVTSGYGGGNSLPIQRRQRMISELSFGGLDLSHLYECGRVTPAP